MLVGAKGKLEVFAKFLLCFLICVLAIYLIIKLWQYVCLCVSMRRCLYFCYVMQ